MTTALLLLLVVVGVPAWMAVFGAPAFMGRLRERLLQTTGPDQVRAGVEENDELYRFARKSFEKASQTTKPGAQVDPTTAAEIAALNLFVEKSQMQMRQRAIWCGAGAAACVMMDVAVAVVALVWLTGTAPEATSTWPAATLWAVRSAILGALSFGLVYLFTALARLLFAEANAALEKRHSLGFGRLYVQMKVLGAPDPRRATRALTETEMLRAFGWDPPPAPPSPSPPEQPVRTLVLPARPASVRRLAPSPNGDGSEAPSPG